MTCLGSIFVINLSSCVFFVLVLGLIIIIIKILDKLWWTPSRIQKMMGLQGIRGPPYTLVLGNTKQISNMINQAGTSRPKDLSHDIFSVVQPHIHSWTQTYGKIYLQWHGLRAQLVVTEPELCKEILNNKDKVYPKREATNYVKKVLGDGLVATTDAKKWAKLRKLAAHSFHGESLKSMIPAMVASAETMVERWRILGENKEVEVFEEFRLFTSEVISRTAFGSSYIEGKDIFDKLMKLGFLLFKNTLTIRLPGISKVFKTRDEIEADKLEKGIHDSIMKIVKKRVEDQKDSFGFGSDFLGLLLKAHHDDDDNQRISMEDLIDECKTFYFAGQETTNTLLAWTVFLLAHHTDWQEEARKEVVQLFGMQTPNNLDNISKLKTMSMILNESLRLYPPVVSLARKAEREVKLGNLIIPADVTLLVSNLAIHQDPRIWGANAQLFRPERFAEGVARASNMNMGGFIPFGAGPRTCVGLNFANIEAKVALSMILQRYSFTLSPGYIHLPIQYVTVRPKHGVQIIINPI